jgi:hypothetical protein
MTREVPFEVRACSNSFENHREQDTSAEAPFDNFLSKSLMQVVIMPIIYFQALPHIGLFFLFIAHRPEASTHLHAHCIRRFDLIQGSAFWGSQTCKISLNGPFSPQPHQKQAPNFSDKNFSDQSKFENGETYVRKYNGERIGNSIR